MNASQSANKDQSKIATRPIGNGQYTISVAGHATMRTLVDNSEPVNLLQVSTSFINVGITHIILKPSDLSTPIYIPFTGQDFVDVNIPNLSINDEFWVDVYLDYDISIPEDDTYLFSFYPSRAVMVDPYTQQFFLSFQNLT